jgi:hypothetical protein
MTFLEGLHIPEQEFIEDNCQIGLFVRLDEEAVDMLGHVEEEPAKR